MSSNLLDPKQLLCLFAESEGLTLNFGDRMVLITKDMWPHFRIQLFQKSYDDVITAMIHYGKYKGYLESAEGEVDAK